VRRVICRNLKLIDLLSLVPSQRMRTGISVVHSNRILNVIYRNTEKKWPAAFQAEILEDLSSIPTVISFLKLPGNSIFLKFELLQNINTASERTCVFYMIFRTKRNFSLFHCAFYLTQSFLYQTMHNTYSFKTQNFLH
jgi:hypothetical protein